MKLTLLLLLTLITCIAPADMHAQCRNLLPDDSLQTDLQTSPFYTSKNEENLLKMDHFRLHSFSPTWAKRFALEISKSVLDDNYGNFFGEQFRPLSVYDFNHSIYYYRHTGDIPFRRTSTIGLFQSN